MFFSTFGKLLRENALQSITSDDIYTILHLASKNPHASLLPWDYILQRF